MRWQPMAIAVSLVGLAACGGGSGGSGGGEMLGDEARRAVLADLGETVILPALRDFDGQAQSLAAAVAAHASDPADTAAKASAQSAWRDAIASFARVEVLQVGPAAVSSKPGGEDLRDLIYAYPNRNLFQIDCRALNGEMVDATTRIDAMGLGALEHLLFNPVQQTALDSDSCPDGNTAQLRADYARAIADFIAQTAARLSQRWEPAQGDFLSEWANAGAGSTVYSRPQDALDALSTALFYAEKETKDRKIACPTGIGATGLTCTGNDVSRVEFPFARASTVMLRNNVQVFRDVFTGLDGGMGMNALLRGIERDDIADKLLARLDATLAQLDQQISPDFEAEVEAISDQDACTNAQSMRSGEPAACALHGLIQDAMTTFRSEVVAALSLATPDNAAGDND